MNQNINLYQPIFRRQKKIFSAETMLTMIALMIAGLVLISVWSQWRYSVLQGRIQQLQEQEDQALERLASLEETLPAQRESPALKRAVETTEAERDLKRRALEVLDDGALGQMDGFSPYLEALGRQRVEPVWLTGIRIDGGGRHLRLAGRTQDASQVPVYLQRLSNEAVYQGTDFRTMEINRTELDTGGTVLEFHLSTRSDDGDNDDEGGGS